MIDSEMQELQSYKPTRSSVLIVLTGWKHCVQDFQAQVYVYNGMVSH